MATLRDAPQRREGYPSRQPRAREAEGEAYSKPFSGLRGVKACERVASVTELVLVGEDVALDVDLTEV